jgi:transcriptional regulator with XRE-family HTH domain
MAEQEEQQEQQSDDTTTTAIAAIKTGPGRYKIPRRELAKREIRRLVIQEGLSGPQIAARLSIPTRTVTRYLQEIYRDDNELLMKPSVEELTTLLNIFRDRIDKQRLEVLAIANDPDVEACDRLEAHDFAASLDWITTKLHFQAPVVIAKLLKAMLKDNPLVEDTQGLNITIANELEQICKMMPPTKFERQAEKVKNAI